MSSESVDPEVVVGIDAPNPFATDIRRNGLKIVLNHDQVHYHAIATSPEKATVRKVTMAPRQKATTTLRTEMCGWIVALRAGKPTIFRTINVYND